jgi:hypothetical protein
MNRSTFRVLWVVAVLGGSQAAWGDEPSGAPRAVRPIEVGGPTASAAGGGTPTSPRKIVSRQKYQSVTLERGVVPDNGFANWSTNPSTADCSTKARSPGATAKVEGQSPANCGAKRAMKP